MSGSSSEDESQPGITLAQVRQQVVELLGMLDRQPRNLHIQAGSVTLDVTWDGGVADDSRPAMAGTVDSVPDKEISSEYLRSPAVGVFYHAREPGAEPFVSVGSEVHPGQQIGIVEAMKLMIPVEADRAGRISAVVKENGKPVEYDEPLFALEAGSVETLV